MRLVEVVQPGLHAGQHGHQDAADYGVGDDQRGAFVQPACHRPRPRQDVGQRLAARVPVADARRLSRIRRVRSRARKGGRSERGVRIPVDDESGKNVTASPWGAGAGGPVSPPFGRVAPFMAKCDQV